MQDINTDIKIRQFSTSLRPDACDVSEEIIQNFYNKHRRSIKAFAYIMHDEDTYTESEVKNWKGTGEVPQPGELKPPHYHIVCSFGKSPIFLKNIAKELGCENNLINNLRGGKTGLVNMLAYITHITNAAIEQGKTYYAPERVKSFVCPEGIEGLQGVNTYEEFADAYEEKNIMTEVNCRGVLKGFYDVDYVRDHNPDYWIKNKQKLVMCRQEYIKTLPMPETVCNFYIGPYDNGNGNKGGIGKSYLSELLAMAQLRLLHPDWKGEDITRQVFDKHVMHAGSTGVSLDSYTGQEIIIWNDTRAYTLIKTFGGIEQLFKALDLHPKAHDFNVKYGKVQLRNSVNIFDGIESFKEFRNELSKRYTDEGFLIQEDKTQAARRFPFFIEVSPETITCHAEMQYLANSGMPFFKKYANSVQEVRTNKDYYAQSNFLYHFYQPAISEIRDVEETVLPENIFEELPGQMTWDEHKLLEKEVKELPFN